MERGKTKRDEVRDEQGRRRFHGAFTGGFSAGYFNSVGSQEGWTPSTFKSSRSSRASAKSQRPEDFMDDEDGLLGRDLEAQLPYDTLGDQSKKILREQAEKQAVGSAIPGIIVDELLASTGLSIGKKLLQMMGWKEGIGVGSRQHRRKGKKGAGEGGGDGKEEDDGNVDEFLPEHLRGSLRPDVIQQGKITFARPNIEVFKLPEPKNDLYGLGFDVDQHAPEFRALRHAAKDEEDRGVYRMSDVVGKSTSSKAGPRNAMGFAMDDDEDDVYDGAMVGGGAGGGEGGGGKYDTVLKGWGEEEEEEDEGLGGHSSAKARRKALDDWIGRAGVVGGGEGGRRGPTRCPTDSRPAPDGFVLGVEQAAFKQTFWAPLTPPRSFVPFHRFDKEETDHGTAIANEKDANRGRLMASSRGTLLGESKPPPLVQAGGKVVTSVFDLMSEEDRKRVLGKAAAVTSSSGGGAAVGGEAEGGAAVEQQQQPQAGLSLVQNVDVFQGMNAALAKRFTAVEIKPPADARKEGLTEGGAKSEASSSATAGGGLIAAPNAKPLKEPARSQGLWYPSALLCKRFGVPVPQHAKFTPSSAQQQQPQGIPGRPGAVPPIPSSATTSALSNKFEKEMDAILPGGGRLSLQQENLVLDEEAIDQDEDGGAAGEKEVDLPAFEEKLRPPMDFFKAIFEASDDGDEESDEEEEGEDEKKGTEEEKDKDVKKGPSWAAPPPSVSKEEAAKLSGDAPTPTDLSPARDYFLQPATTGGESIEDILAKGPTLIKKKRKALVEEKWGGGGKEDGGGGSDSEGSGGLVFGAAVIKKKKKVAKLMTTSAAVAAGVKGEGGGAGGGGEVPPTPPRIHESNDAAALVGGGGIGLEGSASLAVEAKSSEEDSDIDGDDAEGRAGGGSSSSVGPMPAAAAVGGVEEEGKISKKRKKEHKKEKKKHKRHKKDNKKKDHKRKRSK